MLCRFNFLKEKTKAHMFREVWMYKHSVAVIVLVFWNELGYWFWNKVPCVKAKAMCMWLLEVSLR